MERAGGWYHVTSRGIDRREIFGVHGTFLKNVWTVSIIHRRTRENFRFSSSSLVLLFRLRRVVLFNPGPFTSIRPKPPCATWPYNHRHGPLLLLRRIDNLKVDNKSGKRYAIRNLRSGCSNNFVPADGLLTVPCFSSNCICNYPIQTSFSMVHLPVVDAWHREQSK